MVIYLIRRSVLVREADKPGEEPTDITPKEFAVRTTAQEYGGGAFTISEDTVIYSNYKDQRLYKQSIKSKGRMSYYLLINYYVSQFFIFLQFADSPCSRFLSCAAYTGLWWSRGFLC